MHDSTLCTKRHGPGGITLEWDGTRDAEGRPSGVVRCEQRRASVFALLASDDPHLCDARGEWHPLTWDQWTWLLRQTSHARMVAR